MYSLDGDPPDDDDSASLVSSDVSIKIIFKFPRGSCLCEYIWVRVSYVLRA